MIGKIVGGFIVLITGTAIATQIMPKDEVKKETKFIHEKEKHKQTYEEYVKERRSVEKLLKR